MKRHHALAAALICAATSLTTSAMAQQPKWSTRGDLAPLLSPGDANAQAASRPDARRDAKTPRPRPERPPEKSAPPPKAAAKKPPPSKPRKPAPIVALGPSGEICNSPGLFGQRLASIADYGGCAVAAPVRVQKVGDVSIAPRAVTGCRVPTALAHWLSKVVQPAAQASLGQRVARLHQVSGYVCRPRNNEPGARLSFHATGDAIDIASFELVNGVRISVLEDWGGQGPGGPAAAAFLRAAWEGACGPFGTVLGPEADAAHRDHFHLDTAQRRTAFCQ